MAKNKLEYRKDGYSEFLHGLPMPTGSSWQELARAQGWIDASREAQEHADSARNATASAQTEDDQGDSSLKASKALPYSSQIDSASKPSATAVATMQNGSMLNFVSDIRDPVAKMEAITKTANKLSKTLMQRFNKTAGITKREQEESTHHAIISHIHFLRQEAMNIADGQRRARLINKADKLWFKHQYLIG
jgi:hypothetical protein